MIATLLGPLVDLVAYFAATGLGVVVERSQVLSFALAAALSYLPQAYAIARLKSPNLDSSLHLHLIALTLLVFFLRAGVFALLTGRWGWPAPIAIIFTAAATAA